jgi:broad specificity phosphatase PhoE
MQVYVIRHGLSQANEEGIIQGLADSPLAGIGRAQADLLGRYLRRSGVHPEEIFSSPLRRALETAESIAGVMDPAPPVRAVEGLTEVDVGALSGLPLEEAYAKHPEKWAPDVNKWLDFSNFGGESFEKFFGRVESAVRKIMSEWDDLLADRTVFFVTHAGTMRPLLRTLLNAEGDFMYFTFGNCCHVRIEYRRVRDSVRRVLSELVRIEHVAVCMGEKNPGADVEDSIGRKIG